MGLALSAVADVPGRGLLRRRPADQDVARELHGAAARWAARQAGPVAGWCRATAPDGGRLRLALLPCEEPVDLAVAGGRVTFHARTAGAGPGYHAWLAELLDALGAELGLAWQEDGEGYLAHRSFARLQAEQAAWLGQLGRYVLDAAARVAPPLALGLPLGFRPVVAAFALTALGGWSRAWMERLAAAGEAERLRMAATYFPWWEQGLGAAALRGLALARCWVELRWVPPADEAERALCASVLEAFERARALDPGLALPEQEIAELRALLAAGAPVRPPRPDGLGFLRGTVARPLPGGWSIELPGYFQAQPEDGGATQVYRFPGRAVRGSARSLPTPRPQSAAETLGACRREAPEFPLALEDRRYAGTYSFGWNDAERAFVLRAQVARPDGLCVVTIALDDEGDRPWAEAAAASIHDARTG